MRAEAKRRKERSWVQKDTGEETLYDILCLQSLVDEEKFRKEGMKLVKARDTVYCHKAGVYKYAIKVHGEQYRAFYTDYVYSVPCRNYQREKGCRSWILVNILPGDESRWKEGWKDWFTKYLRHIGWSDSQEANNRYFRCRECTFNAEVWRDG